MRKASQLFVMAALTLEDTQHQRNKIGAIWRKAIRCAAKGLDGKWFIDRYGRTNLNALRRYVPNEYENLICKVVP